MNRYWIQLLYVHIMVAEASHSSRLSTRDTSVNIIHIINVMLSGLMVIHIHPVYGQDSATERCFYEHWEYPYIILVFIACMNDLMVFLCFMSSDILFHISGPLCLIVLAAILVLLVFTCG